MTNKRLEWVTFFFLGISLVIVGYFHEPWFDEAQSWQIAKCASLRDVLFLIPHYEAHPPLWHLMLSLPAKLGVPYEIGLKIVSGTAVMVSGWLLLFRSPFPRIVRCLLPFHYFLFYQYGVVSRPYGYMGLVFLLLALTFHKKNEKPWLFSLLLLLECLLSAYGIVLAGGIAAVWLYEICVEKHWNLKNGAFWKDGRIWCLFILLLFALFLVWDISPKEDTVIGFAMIGQRLWKCFLYALFIMLPDSTLIMTLKEEGILRYVELGVLDLSFGILVGVVMLLAILLFSSKEKLKYFLVPYTFFGIFAGYVYFAVHHMGIVALFTLFWLWITWEDARKGWLWSKLSAKIQVPAQKGATYRKIGALLGMLILIVPVFWTVSASVSDIGNAYFFARDAARFMKTHGLEEARVLCEWSGSGLDGKDADLYENMNVNVMKVAVSLQPYFDHNIFMNLNEGDDRQGYVKFRFFSPQGNQRTLELWKEKGIPEVIVGSVNLALLYGDEVKRSDYVAVYRLKPLNFSIWKMIHNEGFLQAKFIYVRRDLLETYGVEAIAESPF